MAAIYMWPIEVRFVLTTTLYPVDVADSMVISGAAVDETGWWELLFEAAEYASAIGDGTLYVIRFDAPEQGPEYAQYESDIGNGTLYVIRFDAPEQGPEYAQYGTSVSDGTLINHKVEADTPDEELEIACVIESDCSMTHI